MFVLLVVLLALLFRVRLSSVIVSRVTVRSSSVSVSVSKA